MSARITAFLTDSTLCIGCKACEVACKEWNQVPGDGFTFTGLSYDNTRGLGHSTWRHVKFVERSATPSHAADAGYRSNAFRWDFSSDVCKHCEHAGCLEACPTGSIVRTEFGGVFIQPDVCNGCGYCTVACPFGVVDRRPDDGRAFKCTFCYDRQKAGLKPACATACPTESILFGDLDLVSRGIRSFHLEPAFVARLTVRLSPECSQASLASGGSSWTSSRGRARPVTLRDHNAMRRDTSAPMALGTGKLRPSRRVASASPTDDAVVVVGGGAGSSVFRAACVTIPARAGLAPTQTPEQPDPRRHQQEARAHLERIAAERRGLDAACRVGRRVDRRYDQSAPRGRGRGELPPISHLDVPRLQATRGAAEQPAIAGMKPTGPEVLRMAEDRHADARAVDDAAVVTPVGGSAPDAGFVKPTVGVADFPGAARQAALGLPVGPQGRGDADAEPHLLLIAKCKFAIRRKC